MHRCFRPRERPSPPATHAAGLRPSAKSVALRHELSQRPDQPEVLHGVRDLGAPWQLDVRQQLEPARVVCAVVRPGTAARGTRGRRIRRVSAARGGRDQRGRPHRTPRTGGRRAWPGCPGEAERYAPVSATRGAAVAFDTPVRGGHRREAVPTQRRASQAPTPDPGAGLTYRRQPARRRVRLPTGGASPRRLRAPRRTARHFCRSCPARAGPRAGRRRALSVALEPANIRPLVAKLPLCCTRCACCWLRRSEGSGISNRWLPSLRQSGG